MPSSCVASISMASPLASSCGLLQHIVSVLYYILGRYFSIHCSDYPGNFCKCMHKGNTNFRL